MLFYRYFNAVENSVSLFKSFKKAQIRLQDNFINTPLTLTMKQ